MVDRPASLKKINKGLYYAYAMYEVEVTLNDTITLPEFDSSKNLNEAWLVRFDTGAEVTCTHVALNVITVTGASTDTDCVLFVFGVKS